MTSGYEGGSGRSGKGAYEGGYGSGNTYGTPPPPKSQSDAYDTPPGRGGRWKWIAVGCAVVGGLSVILGVALVWTGIEAAKKTFSDDPAKAEQIAREVFEYEIPGGSKGVFSMDLVYRMAIVQSLEEPPSVVMVVGLLPATGAGMTPEQFEQQMKQSMQQQQSMNVQQHDTRTETVCGSEVQVVVQKGMGGTPDAQRPFTSWQFTTMRATDMVFCVIAANGENSDANAEAVFRSLECPPAGG